LTNPIPFSYIEPVRIPHSRLSTAFLTVIASGSLVAACSASGSNSSASPTSTTTASAITPSSIPAGTVLRVGDQLSYLQTVLSLAGQNTNLSYTVQYSSFVGGPPMLQAFQAGALDAGFVGSTPLIFAQAAQQPIVAVAGWATPHSTYGLVTKPGETSIKGWANVKGKKVAYQQGTAGEAVVLEGLNSAGLTLSDITPVLLPQTQIASALQGGSADAGVEVEPLTSEYLASNPTANVATLAGAITDRSDYVIATQSTLTNPGKKAALADYLTRLVKSFNYLRSHPDLVTQAVYEKQYGLTPQRAAEVQAATGSASFFALPGEVGPAQQRLANLFTAAGEIPNKINTSSEFDTAFNSLVTTTQGS